MTMGERLRKRRQELHMSQQELAERVSLRRATISEFESGARTSMTTETAKRLARILGVSIDYIVGTWDDASQGDSEPAGVALVGA